MSICMTSGEDSQEFVRICEDSQDFKRGFVRICETLGRLCKDLWGFRRLWERIHRDL